MALVDSPEIAQFHYRLYKLSDDMETFIELTNILSAIETDELLTMKDVHDLLVDLAIRVFKKISRSSIQPPKRFQSVVSVRASNVTERSQGAGGDSKC